LDEDRSQIDPTGEYPAEGRRRVEENALRVLDCLPHALVRRTRDVIELDRGDERGIVVLVTAEAFEFRLPTTEWTMGAYGPAESSRLWRRVETDDLDDKGLAQLVKKALRARAAQFKGCRYCGKEFPPEHRHGRVCHGCAERHEGGVH